MVNFSWRWLRGDLRWAVFLGVWRVGWTWNNWDLSLCGNEGGFSIIWVPAHSPNASFAPTSFRPPLRGRPWWCLSSSLLIQWRFTKIFLGFIPILLIFLFRVLSEVMRCFTGWPHGRLASRCGCSDALSPIFCLWLIPIVWFAGLLSLWKTRKVFRSCSLPLRSSAMFWSCRWSSFPWHLVWRNF